MRHHSIFHVPAYLAFLLVASGCAHRTSPSPETVAFDPLRYPGDSALTCDVLRPPSASTIALQFTGTDSAPAMQRRITAVFDLDGTPLSLSLLAPQPGQTPPRAHLVNVRFHPEASGVRTEMVAEPSGSLESIVGAASAAVTHVDSGGIAQAREFMKRLWGRRCAMRIGAHPPAGGHRIPHRRTHPLMSWGARSHPSI